MELWPNYAASRTNTRDRLTALDILAGAHQQLGVMGIRTHPAAGVFYEQQVAEATQLIPGISDHPVFGRSHCGPLSRQDVDTVIVQTARPRPKSDDDPSMHWPQEPATRSWRRSGQRDWRRRSAVPHPISRRRI